MTKEIRLLTGRHAGARIKFNPTQMRIGNDDDADIQIRDWDQPIMQINLGDDGALTIADAQGVQAPIVLEDFKPLRFGHVVLCAGDADAEWPSDIALLEALLTPAPATQNGPAAELPLAPLQKSRKAAHLVGIVGAVALAVGGASMALPAVLRPHANDALRLPAAQPTLAALQRALDQLHQADVTVKRQGARFAVEGVVPDRASATLARNTLESIAPGRIDWRVGCVDEIARDLQESLHDPALHVNYVGNRVFSVSGVAKNIAATQATLGRMSTDLHPMIDRVAQAFTADDAIAMPSAIDSLLSVDGLQYVEASDGVKHFIDSNAARRNLN